MYIYISLYIIFKAKKKNQQIFEEEISFQNLFWKNYFFNKKVFFIEKNLLCIFLKTNKEKGINVGKNFKNTLIFILISVFC